MESPAILQSVQIDEENVENIMARQKQRHKRMRIIRPPETDEEDAEYIEAKQKQQQKFKSRLESIFEKFGNMNESQSDIIDFNTNQVVVDRGHLRRIDRRLNGKGKGLLDTFLSTGDSLRDSEEGEANEGDSEDELALPQSVKSKTTVPPEQDMSNRQLEPALTNAQQPTSPPSDVSARSVLQTGVPQTPNAPNPVPNVLPYLHFPQTPAGQEAQSAFVNWMHSMAKLQNDPNTPVVLANVAPAPTTPTTTGDKVAPPTDPKWFYPPLSAQPHSCPTAQSSPLPSHSVAPTAKVVDEQHADIISIDAGEERPLMTLYTRPDESSPTKPKRSSPRVGMQRRGPGPPTKYHFTREDDIYISKRKTIDGASWAVIWGGREKWKRWPVSALRNRWTLIKNQDLHLQGDSVAPTGDSVNGGDHISTEEVPAAPKPPPHLPTPSSSEHEDCHQDLVVSTEENKQERLSSISHYDDDELDLLSLAGSDPDEDHPPPAGDDTTAVAVASQDVILPSIETRDLVDEEDTMLEEDLPSTPQTQDFVMTPTRASVDLLTQDTVMTPTRASSATVKTEPLSSPTTLGKRKRSPPYAKMIPDSQDNKDGAQEDSSNVTVASQEPVEPVSTSLHYPSNQQSTHTALVSSRDASLDLTGDDELLPPPADPTTPSLKCKHDAITMPMLFRTPKPRDVDGNSETGTTKSTSKAHRKSFLKQVKREWTRKGTPAKENVVGKSAGRRSLGGALGNLDARKRKWMDDGDDGSEDELTIR
ncbi:hypothetical protein AA0119_g12812 [Alternaria tenuissima]|uniref:Myb-like domain-containing protein n=1 Tax=Alternaria tenuissima TaxID=119927 RepID=A0ABY0FQF6_9PLEO|nr:hypothetical protein AA0119_g12812 [Alternaria tenuissima]